MKKLIAFTLIAITLLSVLSVSVLAEQIDVQKIEYVNEFIEKANKTEKAYYEVKEEKDLAKVEEMVLKTNEKILQMVYNEMEAKKVDIDKLVEKTDEMARKTIEKAADMGYEVICEYIAYEINGEIVLIDPLIVIKR
ncbi:MAG: hypothetical protein CVU97_03280 [Firmicutes bacterium HGW-Firmicutes-21]|nr:MAG: hypothetical protein CVU97_03280 [Firmicutes bacterium HGW-Firmicutes-21]